MFPNSPERTDGNSQLSKLWRICLHASSALPNDQARYACFSQYRTSLSELEGQLQFANDVVLDVWELIDHESNRILNYSYEFYQANEKVIWYDPFEHPHIPELASTYPHHKHVLPNIKHNRIPAPSIRFDQPNLDILIHEVE